MVNLMVIFRFSFCGQTVQFYGKFGAKSQCNVHLVFWFLCFLFSGYEYPLLKLFQKNQNCLLKMKLGTYTNKNILNLKVIITFSLLDYNYPFGVNVVQKSIIV